MANRYGYQYETSPRKLEPEYRKVKRKPTQKIQKKKVQTKNKKVKKNTKQKSKMSFEFKFFVNSMLCFALIFAMIACQALVEQRYKEKENLKKYYNELLADSGFTGDIAEDTRQIATEYGMQTKSATLINLDTTDYIESSEEVIETEEGFFDKILNWIKGIF